MGRVNKEEDVAPVRQRQAGGTCKIYIEWKTAPLGGKCQEEAISSWFLVAVQASHHFQIPTKRTNREVNQ